MYKGHFGSPSHFLRQHSCPSHRAVVSIVAHYGPSSEMNTLRPHMNVPAGGGEGVCAREDSLPWQEAPSSPQDPSPVAHHSPSVLSDQRLAITHTKAHLLHFNKALRHLHKWGNVLSHYRQRVQSLSLTMKEPKFPRNKILSFRARQICCLFLSFPCSQWIPPSLKSPASQGTVEKPLIVKELLL